MCGFTRDEMEAEETTKPQTQMGPQFMSVYFCARKSFQGIYTLYPLIPPQFSGRGGTICIVCGAQDQMHALCLESRPNALSCMPFPFTRSCLAVLSRFLWLANVLPHARRYSRGSAGPPRHHNCVAAAAGLEEGTRVAEHASRGGTATQEPRLSLMSVYHVIPQTYYGSSIQLGLF